MCHFRDRTRYCIKFRKIRPAFFTANFKNTLSICAPDRPITAGPTRRCIISEHAGTDVVIEFLCQIARLGVRRELDCPKIGLGVGIHRLSSRGDKGHLLPVRAKRKTFDAHLDRGEPGWSASSCRDRVKLALGQFIVWLIDVQRSEVNGCPVGGPNRLRLIEPAIGQLFWLNFLIGRMRSLDQPNVLGTFWIEITFIIRPIDGARDNVDIALVRPLSFPPCRRTWRSCLRSRRIRRFRGRLF